MSDAAFAVQSSGRNSSVIRSISTRYDVRPVAQRRTVALDDFEYVNIHTKGQVKYAALKYVFINKC